MPPQGPHQREALESRRVARGDISKAKCLNDAYFWLVAVGPLWLMILARL